MKRVGAQIDSVFVYGTLMKGFANHELYLAKHVTEGTPGEMRGELYHLSYGFPAVVDGEGTVKGEIYRVRDIRLVLPALDYLEDFNQPGEDDLYRREIRDVRDNDGNIILCYVYLWSADRIDELKQNGVHINHGDWKKFIRDNESGLEEEYDRNC